LGPLQPGLAIFSHSPLPTKRESFEATRLKMAKKFVIPKDNDAYPIQAPDGKWLNSKKEATAYKAKLDAKAAVKPVTTAKAATAPGKATRNDDGDVKLTSQFKDSSGRNVTYDFAGQPGTTVKPQDQLKTNLQTGPQMVSVDGKQTVVIPEGMQNNPGVPTAELQYDPALGQWTVPAGGANGFMTAHPQTPDFSPQLAFALASGGLLAAVAPALFAGAGLETGGAGAVAGGGTSGVGGAGFGATGLESGSLLADAMQGFTAADAAAGANALGVGAVPGVAPAASGGFSAAQLAAAGINPATVGLGAVAPAAAPAAPAASVGADMGLGGLGGSGYGQPGSLLGDAMQGFTAADASAGANALGVGAIPGVAPAATGGFTAAQLTAAGLNPALAGLGAAAGPVAGAAGAGGSTLGSILSGAGSAISGLGSSFAPTGNTDLSKLLGSLLPAGLGYLGADSQANAMKDIYNQTRADRMPALTAYNTALQNPNTFYQSAPAMGAVDAVLRKLSVNGNPASNPGSLSQAAAYNLGGYNDYLRGLTPAAFGTANTEANISMNGAGADAGKYNAVGYGLGQYFNPQPNLNDLLKNFSLNIGGVKA
jgi:hypothetical protein